MKIMIKPFPAKKSQKISFDTTEFTEMDTTSFTEDTIFFENWIFL